MSARVSKPDLSDLLREIETMSRDECRLSWKKAFGKEPAKYLSISFMQRVLANDLQCRKLGGHSAETRRALKNALNSGGEKYFPEPVADGSVLVREWNGRVYRVTASEAGYVLDGSTYASLSAVAKHITGAHWSGPRFFGLSRKRGA